MAKKIIEFIPSDDLKSGNWIGRPRAPMAKNPQGKVIPLKKAPLITGFKDVDDFIAASTKGWKRSPDGSYYDPKQWTWDAGKNKLVESEFYGRKNIWKRRLKDTGKLAKAIGRRDWYEAGWYTPYTRAEDFIRYPKSYLDAWSKPTRTIWDKTKGMGSKVLKHPLTKFGTRVLGGTAAMVGSELDWSNPDNYFMPEYTHVPITGKTIWSE